MILQIILRIISEFRMSHRRIAFFLAALLMMTFATSDAHAPIDNHSTTSWKMLSRCTERKHKIDEMEPHKMQISVDSGIDSPSFTNLNSKLHRETDDLIGSREEEDLGKSDECGSKSHHQATSEAVEFHIGRRRLLQSAEFTHNSNAIIVDEVVALLAFKKAIYDDPLNLMANWTTSKSLDHCRAWMGVTCDSNGRVTSINFTASQLKGTITSMLGNLTHLVNLTLATNNLTGGIPRQLGNCNKLSSLDVGDNLLTGVLPIELGNLSQLVTLNISHNMFSGSIPIGNACKKLTRLDAQYANLSGPIPSNLGGCRYLSSIELIYNNLSGPIPKSLGKLHRLRVLTIGGNKLSGKIPESLGKCRSMFFLELSGNNLRGTVPGKLSGMEHLIMALLSNNQFTGIGTEFWSMKNLVYLELSSNSLRGERPQELGNMTSLKLLELSNNFLSGQIPNTIGGCQSLESMDLSSNHFVGDIPTSLGQLTQLTAFDISNNSFNGNISNNFVGDIPTSLGQLTQLTAFDISSNRFQGNIFIVLSSLQGCTNLTSILVYNNSFVGTLELDFRKLPLLQYFSASSNNITGPMPPSFAAFNSSLIFVDLSQNQITGVIPSQIVSGHLQSLRVLDLANNNLHGSIPSWIGELKALQVLDLSNNKLGGSIPSNINNLDGFKVDDNSSKSSYGPFTLNQSVVLVNQGSPMTYSYVLMTMTYFDLSTNALVGTIPPTLAELVSLKYLNISNNLIGGEIPYAIGTNMSALISLDISRNNLSGAIPSTFTHLQSLATFNVSSNNLQGAILTSTQFSTFTNASYLLGNDGLCGNVVNCSCSKGATNQSEHNSTREDFFEGYVSLSGFEVGIAVGFCSMLLFIVSWGPTQNFVFKKSSRIKKVQPSHYGLFKPRTYT